GGSLLQRFVRPLLVVDRSKPVKRPLLQLRCRAGRLGRFSLQRSVHALMRPVILRLPGPGPLQSNAQADPPDGQLRKPRQRVRPERNSIIRADHLRESVLPEDPLEGNSRSSCAGAGKRLAPQQVATVGVDDRQRITEPRVAKAELAFEVCRPDAVRSVRCGTTRAPCSLRPPPLSLRLDQPFPAQDLPDRAQRRPGCLRMKPLQPRPQLLRSPGWTLLSQRHDRRNHLRRRCLRLPPRGALLILQRGESPRFIPREPLVTNPPTDPELLADLAHRGPALESLEYKPRSLFHRAGLTPGHRAPPSSGCSSLRCVLPMCPVCTTDCRSPPHPPPPHPSLLTCPLVQPVHLVTLSPRHPVTLVRRSATATKIARKSVPAALITA